jgi:hypothetical protein
VGGPRQRLVTAAASRQVLQDRPTPRSLISSALTRPLQSPDCRHPSFGRASWPKPNGRRTSRRHHPTRGSVVLCTFFATNSLPGSIVSTSRAAPHWDGGGGGGQPLQSGSRDARTKQLSMFARHGLRVIDGEKRMGGGIGLGAPRLGQTKQPTLVVRFNRDTQEPFGCRQRRARNRAARSRSRALSSAARSAGSGL